VLRIEKPAPNPSSKTPKSKCFLLTIFFVFLYYLLLTESIYLVEDKMKVLVHYQDNEDDSKHKTLKITMPKSWKNGPTEKLLEFFIESYNQNLDDSNKLDASLMHLEVKRQREEGLGNSSDSRKDSELASDDIILECMEDRQDIFVMHGVSRTRQELLQIQRERQELQEREKQNTVACVHFGCRQRFPNGGPYPKCIYHKSPPIFHETAKYWSCCPHKKAYDWEEFQAIPGCQEGICSQTREDRSSKKDFLGGCDVREAAGAGPPKLRSIEDFNMQQQQKINGVEATTALDRLKRVLEELGVENELFDQVVTGIQKEVLADSTTGLDDTALHKEIAIRLGKKLKVAMKAIAVEQLRVR
jgi:hypothetical protein